MLHISQSMLNIQTHWIHFVARFYTNVSFQPHTDQSINQLIKTIHCAISHERFRCTWLYVDYNQKEQQQKQTHCTVLIQGQPRKASIRSSTNKANGKSFRPRMLNKRAPPGESWWIIWPICENLMSSSKRKYITYCSVIRKGPSLGQGYHAQKISLSLDMWFWRYASGQTERATNALITILCMPPRDKVINHSLAVISVTLVTI